MSYDELEEAIMQIKVGEAPDHNKISTKMIKYLGNTKKIKLLDIYNKAQTEEVIPRDWQMAKKCLYTRKEIKKNVPIIDKYIDRARF